MSHEKRDSSRHDTVRSNVNSPHSSSEGQESASMVLKRLRERLGSVNARSNASSDLASNSADRSSTTINLLSTDMDEFNDLVKDFLFLFAPGTSFGRTDIIEICFLYLTLSLYTHHWANDPRMLFGKQKLEVITVGQGWELGLDLQAAKFLHEKLVPAIENANINDFQNSRVSCHQQFLMINANLFDFLTNLKKHNTSMQSHYNLPLSFAKEKIQISRQKAVSDRLNRTSSPAQNATQQDTSYEQFFNHELDEWNSNYIALRTDSTSFIEVQTGLELDYPLQFKSCPLSPDQVAATIELDGKKHYYDKTSIHNPIHHIKSQSLLNGGIVRVPVDVTMGVGYNEHTPLSKDVQIKPPQQNPSRNRSDTLGYLNQHLKPHAQNIAEQLNSDFVQQYYKKYYYPLITMRKQLRQHIIDLQTLYLACHSFDLKNQYKNELDELFSLEMQLSQIVNKRVLEKLIIRADTSIQLRSIITISMDIFTLHDMKIEAAKIIATTTSEISEISNQLDQVNLKLNSITAENNSILEKITALDEKETPKDFHAALRVNMESLKMLKQHKASLEAQLAQKTNLLKKNSIEHDQNSQQLSIYANENKELLAAAENYFDFDKIEKSISEVHARLAQSQSTIATLQSQHNSSSRSQNNANQRRSYGDTSNRNRIFSQNTENRDRDRDSSPPRLVDYQTPVKK